ncbi:hypothetical protein [Aeromonas phage AS-yj]|uniref:Uncharacterized protein n=1 Tax=Aeromonas phage AS-yj TaxID=2026115 RepID=A0A291LEM2_9CAUD|nr:hypothetical protein [Aeromonas phage AS-yj]
MKVQFKSEEAMTEFKTLDRNNEELANAYGMSPIPIGFVDEEWWDIFNEEDLHFYTINISDESHYFDILEK